MTDSQPDEGKGFFGWWIVAFCMMISFYVAGVVTYGFTAVIEPLIKEFDWTYAEVSIAASIRGVESSLLAPIAGICIDRFGPRKVYFTGAAVTGLGFVLFSRINSIFTFYAVFILIATGITTCSGVVPMTVVVKWFRKRLATATGIVVCGSALGGLLVPVISHNIDLFGWRTAMLIVGIGAWILLLPLALMIHNPPWEQSSRSTVKKETAKVAPESSDEINMTPGQAFTSPAMWHIGFGLACHFMIVNAITTHIMPYLGTVGIQRTTAAIVASALPLASILGRLSFGWFGDRFSKRGITAIGASILGLSAICLMFVGAGTWMIIIFVICFGVGFGGPVAMQPAIAREYFGRNRTGTILGLLMGSAMLGGIIGPPFAGFIFDHFNSYMGAWIILTVLLMIGAVSLATTPKPKRAITSAPLKTTVR